MWRKDEYTHSNKSTSQSLKLLRKETRLIQKIDTMQRDVRRKKQEERFENQVLSLTKPITWKMSHGCDIEIHRPIMEYSKSLQSLYSLLLSCYERELGGKKRYIFM